MLHLEATNENIALAAQALQKGELIAFPTETVYGLGGNALDAHALAAIFAAKKRPYFDPLIVHIGALSQLSRVVSSLNPQAERLIEKFWPGPLTLVLPKCDAVPSLASSGLPTVAVRMPSHPIALALINAAATPIAAPSANPFGRLSPTQASHVLKNFNRDVYAVLDGGPSDIGVESTIIGWQDNHAVLLRPGGLAKEEIEELVGPLLSNSHTKSVTHEISSTGMSSPGQLNQHYSPRSPLTLLTSGHTVTPSQEDAYLSFSNPHLKGFGALQCLSPSADLREAAARLFDCLHRLDAFQPRMIFAEAVPEEGLGLAIMDRLRRAQGNQAT